MFASGLVIGLVAAWAVYKLSYSDGSWIYFGVAAVLGGIASIVFIGMGTIAIAALVAATACVFAAAVDRNVRAAMNAWTVLFLLLSVAAGIDIF